MNILHYANIDDDRTITITALKRLNGYTGATRLEAVIELWTTDRKAQRAFFRRRGIQTGRPAETLDYRMQTMPFSSLQRQDDNMANIKYRMPFSDPDVVKLEEEGVSVDWHLVPRRPRGTIVLRISAQNRNLHSGEEMLKHFPWLREQLVSKPDEWYSELNKQKPFSGIVMDPENEWDRRLSIVTRAWVTHNTRTALALLMDGAKQHQPEHKETEQ